LHTVILHYHTRRHRCHRQDRLTGETPISLELRFSGVSGILPRCEAVTVCWAVALDRWRGAPPVRGSSATAIRVCGPFSRMGPPGCGALAGLTPAKLHRAACGQQLAEIGHGRSRGGRICHRGGLGRRG